MTYQEFKQELTGIFPGLIFQERVSKTNADYIVFDGTSPSGFMKVQASITLTTNKADLSVGLLVSSEVTRFPSVTVSKEGVVHLRAFVVALWADIGMVLGLYNQVYTGK